MAAANISTAAPGCDVPDTTPTAKLRFVPTEEPNPLREEVAALIEPWVKTNAEPWHTVASKPPFTAEQLIVFAFVMSNQEKMSEKEVHCWILRTFQYYRDIVIDEYTWAASNAEEDEEGIWINDCSGHFFNALRSFDLPLVKRTYQSSAATDLEISFSAARIYLRQWLEPSREGNFKFMALPAELREKIYKMSLVYPEPGLSKANQSHSFRNQLVHPSEGLFPKSKSWQAEQQFRLSILSLPPMHEALSILRVSKQVYHEALPVFYALNQFHFDCLPALYAGLYNMGEDVKKHIRYLHITMCLYGWGNSWHEELLALGKMLDSIAPRKLVFSLPKHRGVETLCGQIVSGTDNASVDLSKLGELDGLGQFVTLAQRAELLEWQDEGIFKTWVTGKLEGLEEGVVSDENVSEPSQNTATRGPVAPFWSRCSAQAVTAVSQFRFWLTESLINNFKVLNRSR